MGESVCVLISFLEIQRIAFTWETSFHLAFQEEQSRAQTVSLIILHGPMGAKHQQRCKIDEETSQKNNFSEGTTF